MAISDRLPDEWLTRGQDSTYEEYLRAQKARDSERYAWEVIGSHLGRMVEGQDRLSRVLASILEQNNRIMGEFLTELRMSKIREAYWEQRVRELDGDGEARR